MPRPPKYATAEEAARNNLYSKMAGQNLGLSIDEFIHLATGRCEICGLPPQEALIVDRRDGTCKLMWHYVARGENKHIALCRMCKTLAQTFKLNEIISHCARIMARRMWKVHSKWTDQLFQAQEKRFLGRSDDTPDTGMSE